LRGHRLNIVYLHNEKLYLKRGWDVGVMKTAYALAAFTHKLYLLIGKTDPDETRLLNYYGLSPKSNITIVQLPILRRKGKIRLSWGGVYNFFALCWLWRMRKGIDLIHLRSVKLADFLLKFRWVLKIPMVYEIHQLPRLFAPEDKGIPLRPSAGPGKDKRLKRVFSRVNGLIVTTKALEKGLNTLYDIRVPASRVPSGCELPAEAPPPLSRHSPREIYYIGGLYPLQGVDLLVEAMKHI
jgi:glycosyltransferase involved in cell wall biosynthesis